jgi:hypothetical protein
MKKYHHAHNRRPIMAGSFRPAVFFALLLSVVSVIATRADDPSATRKSLAKPSAKGDSPIFADTKIGTVPKPRVLVTISKETTYITEPLRPDGYPDYVAALNQRFSAGVTPENNAAVLFWKAMGPGMLGKKDQEAYFKMLGIPPLPESGDYFVGSGNFVDRHKSEIKGTTDEPNAQEKELWRQFEVILKRPWSKQEFPLWAEWVAANEKPLALLVEVSKRPRRYDPMLGEMVITVLLPAAQQHREVARALIARAMLRIHDGKSDEAWEDLMACHRLARLVGQGATLIEVLVAVTLDGMACAGDHALLEHGKLSSAQIAKMQEYLAKLPPIPKMVDKLDVAERIMFLDCVTTMAREGPSTLTQITGSEVREKKSTVESLMDSIGTAMIDWDIILRMGNSWHDRICDACRKPTRIEQKKAWDSIDKDLRRLAKSSKGLTSFGLSMLGSPRKTVSERAGQILVALLLPAFSAAMNAEDRATMQFELTKLAFALAAYRAEHGSYPKRLADLVPKYVAEVPKDIFNDALLHYDQKGDGYLLYSVGVNGKDDGGKGYGESEGGETCDDLAVRMPAAP